MSPRENVTNTLKRMGYSITTYNDFTHVYMRTTNGYGFSVTLNNDDLANERVIQEVVYKMNTMIKKDL